MLNRVQPPSSGRAEYWDTHVPELVLRITPTGKKTFAVSKRVNGRRPRVTLGTYPLVGLEEARALARETVQKLARGIDPRLEKEDQRQKAERADLNRFEHVVEEFIQRYARPRQKRWRETERIFQKYVLPKWADLDIGKIGRRDVVDLLDIVEDRHGKWMTNRVLAAIRKLMNWAMVERAVIDATPVVRGMARLREADHARDRVLTRQEIESLWNACTEDGYPFGPFAKMLLITGQRRDEVAGMKWSEIDDGEALWTLPREATKADRAHTVPLSQLALDVLESVPRQQDYVFSTLGVRPISGFSKAKRRLATVSGVDNWRYHDLRRTVATNMTGLGIDRLVVAKVLNQRDGSVTGIYDRHRYDLEKREALDAWASQLQAIVGQSVENVVELRPDSIQG